MLSTIELKSVIGKSVLMTSRLKLIILGIFPLFLTACTTTTSLNIHHIKSLATEAESSGEFRGLEFLADPIPGQLKNRVNIFYLHGIGWTEDPDADQLGNKFLEGVANAYEMELEGDIIQSPCGDGNAPSAATLESNHIYITTEGPKFYETAIPGTRLKLDRLVCMDKQTLDVNSTLEYVVYRIFWDQPFWDQLQSPHVGQDDGLGDSEQVIAGLRRKYNKRLKDDLVNFGFSDAVMYLGPAGTDIRNAIRGAMCSAALDAAGHAFVKQGSEIGYGQACRSASATSIQTNQFAFVTESLGSKIAYDLLREALTDGKDTIVDDMMAGSEIYMLANQIALLSLADLTTQPKGPARNDPTKTRPKIVALSEVNDFLTYELNPFFEQLWRRQYTGNDSSPSFDANTRALIAERLGFDFVDIRLEFADPIIPVFKGLVDPLQAHSDHADEPEVVLLLLCGVKNGAMHDEACLATAEIDES